MSSLLVPSAEASYLFRHALLRDAAYQLQLPGDRARLHRLAFDTIEAIVGGRPPELSELDDPKPGQTPAPHATDPFASELALHARAAAAPALTAVRRLYLRRAAEHIERQYRYESAVALWEELASLLDGSPRAEALRRAAAAAQRAGRVTDAERLYVEALRLSREGSDRRLEGIARGGLAGLWFEMGRLKEARAACEEALALHREVGNRPFEGRALDNLALMIQSEGRIEEAERMYEKALAIGREIGSRRSQAGVLSNLACLHGQTGSYQKAESLFAMALDLHRATGDKSAEGAALGNLATLKASTGDLGEARRLIVSALALDRETGNRRREGINLGNLACVLQDLKSPGAEKVFGDALAIHREVGNRSTEGSTLGNLAGLHLDSGRPEIAERLLLEALEIHRQTGHVQSEGVVLGMLANSRRSSGRFDDAESLFLRALEIHRRVRHRRFEGSHLCDYALLLLSTRRTEKAREQWREGAAILRGISDLPNLEEKTAEMRAACAKAAVPPFDQGGS